MTGTRPRPPIVDAHHHLWDLSLFPYRWLAPEAPPRRFGDHRAIKRTYLPEDYRADLAALNVVASVHVQANCGADDPVMETAWLQECADRDGCPNAIVAEADLTLDDIAGTIARHAVFPACRGVRAFAAWDRAGNWRFADRAGVLSDPAFRRGAAALADAGLSLDLVVTPEQLPEVAALSRALPELAIAVNHLAMLDPSAPDAQETWELGLAAIAPCDRVHLKVSGLWTIDLAWSVERLRPYVDQALETLGADRLMYGSNLPVEKVNTAATRQIEVLTEILTHHGSEAHESVLAKTAARFYRIDLAGALDGTVAPAL